MGESRVTGSNTIAARRARPRRRAAWSAGGAIVVLALAGIGQIGLAGNAPAPGPGPGRYAPGGETAFERAGASFPGAALYTRSDDTGGTATINGATLAPVGPAARPFLLAGTLGDRLRAEQCLTAAVYYEAALEPDDGQRAVAQVVLNRVAHPAYPDSVCGVVYQGSERATGCQFSFSCDGAMARSPMAAFWTRARRVAERALAGYVYRPVGLATHYHTSAVAPFWAPSLDFVGTIGAHRFYRWRGLAGQPQAFYARYVGNEPVPGPSPRRIAASAAPAPLDPLALARAFERSQPAAPAPLAAPAYAEPAVPAAAIPAMASKLAVERPQSGAVRPEYQNSGRWLREPGS